MNRSFYGGNCSDFGTRQRKNKAELWCTMVPNSNAITTWQHVVVKFLCGILPTYAIDWATSKRKK